MRNDNSELPEGWVEVPLSEVIQPVETGKRPKGGVQHIREGMPSIGGEHLSDDGGFKFETLKFVPYEFAESVRNGWISRKDILIVKDGATTGKTAFVDSKFPFERALINEHVLICRPFDGVSPQLLFHYLKSDRGQKEILKDFRGAAQGGISKSFATKVDLPVMPQAEQRRIVGKIEALQERSRNAREALAEVGPLLEQLRKSLLAAAFRGDLTADWRTSNPNVQPAAELLNRIRQERREKWEQAEFTKYEAKGKHPPKNWKDKYKEPESVDDSELPELPEGWHWATFDTFIEFVTSGSRGWAKYYSKRGPLFVRSQNINTDSLVLDDVAHVSPPSGSEGIRTRIIENDLLITITGANVAKAAFVNIPIDEAYVSQHVALARPVDPNFSRYLHLWTVSPDNGRSQLLGDAYGNGKPGLNLDNLKQMKVAVAPLEEQAKILEIIQYAMTGIEAIKATTSSSNSELTQLDQSILAKAFQGELVPQDPNDEPASVLLERIREGRELERVNKNRKVGRKGTTKPVANSSAPSSATASLLDVLRTAETRLHVDDLQAASGLSSTKFYSQLKEAIASGSIKEEFDDDNRYLVPAK